MFWAGCQPIYILLLIWQWPIVKGHNWALPSISQSPLLKPCPFNMLLTGVSSCSQPKENTYDLPQGVQAVCCFQVSICKLASCTAIEDSALVVVGRTRSYTILDVGALAHDSW